MSAPSNVAVRPLRSKRASSPAVSASAASLLRAALVQALGPSAAGHDLDAAARQLAPLFLPQAMARGAALVSPGDRWAQAYLVDQGLLRLYFLRRDGREFNKNFIPDGTLVCPLTPAMWDEPSLFGIACIERTHLWRCDAARWRHALDARGLWGPLQREHDLLALDGRQRYETFCRRMPALAGRVPLLHLASYLGLTDVSLSRLRRGRPR